MSRKGAPAWKSWTTEEEDTLRRLYPTGGITASMAALPGRTEHAIRTRVALLELKLTFLAKFEIVSAAALKGRQPSERRARRLARTARAPIDEVLQAWTKRRAGGAA